MTDILVHRGDREVLRSLAENLDAQLSEAGFRALIEGTARPWHDAGYTVEYRRFYPHLTTADLARYHTVLLLLGREPEAPSDGLTAGDLAILDAWVPGGGVAVLGYAGEGEGTLDRWVANRWLASQGAGIAIGDGALEDTTVRSVPPRTQSWAEGRRLGDDPLGSVYDPFPMGRNHALEVRRSSEVLAVASRRAFVRTPKAATPRGGAPIAAAARVGDGLVVVISRHALGALGPENRPSTMPLLQLGALAATHDFLTALARWTRRPAEWAHVPPAEHATAATLAGAPLPVELQPPAGEPPPGVKTEPLARPAKRDTTRATGVPGWIRQMGMRALWAPLLLPREAGPAPRSTAALDSLVGFLDQAGLNLLAGDADPETVADSLHHRWEERSAVRRACFARNSRRNAVSSRRPSRNSRSASSHSAPSSSRAMTSSPPRAASLWARRAPSTRRSGKNAWCPPPSLSPDSPPASDSSSPRSPSTSVRCRAASSPATPWGKNSATPRGAKPSGAWAGTARSIRCPWSSAIAPCGMPGYYRRTTRHSKRWLPSTRAVSGTGY